MHMHFKKVLRMSDNLDGIVPIHLEMSKALSL
jgi:hypothetical protein